MPGAPNKKTLTPFDVSVFPERHAIICTPLSFFYFLATSPRMAAMLQISYPALSLSASLEYLSGIGICISKARWIVQQNLYFLALRNLSNSSKVLHFL